MNDLKIGDKWEIDSAAIGGWHVGNPPDWRALDTMKNHNVPYNNHCRQVIFFKLIELFWLFVTPTMFTQICMFKMYLQITKEDFNYYDYIFGMDEANMKDLNKKAPKDCKAKLLMFGDFDPQGDRIIRDPYYVR